VKSNNIKKIDLIKNLSLKTGFSENYSKKLISELISIFSYQIKNGKLNLKDLGVLKIINKKERIGRNPKTREQFIISARKSISFTPSQKLIQKLNN
tara:strand:- start:151 stop:438 length:288 start_codon:yes stop_codon:yes gene_type:complete